jgi:hypothetical protein
MYEMLSARTRPPLPPALLLAGRDAEAEALRAALAGPPQVVPVRGGSREEAAAFMAAALGVGGIDADLAPDQPVWVGDARTFERLVLDARPMQLVVTIDDVELGDAEARGNHVLLALGRGDYERSGVITLPRPAGTAGREALEGAGVAFDRADQLAVLARRSFRRYCERCQVRRLGLDRAGRPAPKRRCWPPCCCSGAGREPTGTTMSFKRRRVGHAQRSRSSWPRSAPATMRHGRDQPAKGGDFSTGLDIFEVGQDETFSHPPHTGLLWALERIAWSPEHLTRVTLVLGELAEHDPGGRWSNRPLSTLRATFLAWYPNMDADLTARLAAIDALRTRWPEAAWRLQLALLPKNQELGPRSARPRFRDWGLEWRPAAPDELIRTIHELVSRLAQDADQDTKRWTALVAQLYALPPGDRDGLLGGLASLDPAAMDRGDRLALWLALVEEGERHLRFQDADWSLSRDQAEELLATAEPATSAPWQRAMRPTRTTTIATPSGARTTRESPRDH